MPIKLWCCKYKGLPRLRPSLLILGPDPHLILAVWLEAVEGKCLLKYDAIVPGVSTSQTELEGGVLSYLSLSFLDKGGIMFVQFDLFTVPFLVCSYNL